MHTFEFDHYYTLRIVGITEALVNMNYIQSELELATNARRHCFSDKRGRLFECHDADIISFRKERP
ncbi:hypothetical protein G7062_00345 [Erysipelothrix sp. HDW6C]|uniref:hypothetical protein n=1 Tax=Erysipelothrix sp. HDW6C TaxID=2714930 RepID=UPI00140BE65D|nr:hypothetical protein [Erysipelothrix sp. HDW6C]QIK68824.1 hypothetical protein G7062_00345 [Erysipelothrix sp. HDW6C]